MENRVLLIDNYDSFTHNIAHIIKELGYEIDIFRNDAIALEDVEKYEKIILSPGPGIPNEAGILLPVIERFAPTKKSSESASASKRSAKFSARNC